MGAAVSKSTAEIQQEIIQRQVQRCPVSSCQNIVQGDINIEATGGATVRGVTFTQQCAVDNECLFQGVAETGAAAATQAAADAAAGLGVAVSEADVFTSQQLLNEQIQECGAGSVENLVEGSINIRAAEEGTVLEDVTVSQFGNVQQRCVLDGLTRIEAEATAAAESTATGLFGGPFGIGLIALAIVAFLLLRGGGKGGGKGGEGGGGGGGILIFLAIVAGAAAIWFFFFREKPEPEPEEKGFPDIPLEPEEPEVPMEPVPDGTDVVEPFQSKFGSDFPTRCYSTMEG